ncbi:MAG: hypothetical protein PQJ59_02270 [Spirochaetales bacterium]|nr:hypothetical protein [Spirochaetales bacterium]
MRDIKDYNDQTNPYELFTHIYWRIMNREITLISELEAYLTPIPEGPAKDYTMKTAFKLIKEIHWGFFSDLDRATYPFLWKQLTIQHPNYPSIGELKRNISITDIYTAFVDIHGYTDFCQTHGKHSSMLQLLDNCIEEDIRKICRDNHVMGNRARGDEIILVGTSAYDVLNAVILIADYFGDKKLSKDLDVVKERKDQYLKLPKLTISAGIGGGKKYSVLFITAAGDLSGSVVNTAARLQSQANKISSSKNHILTTNQVTFSYKKDLEKNTDPYLLQEEPIFLDLGPVGFKGVDLRLSEVVVEPNQTYRATYQKEFLNLFDALKSHSWTDGIFACMIDLIKASTRVTPPFKIPLAKNKHNFRSLSNDTIITMADKTNDLFYTQKDFSQAGETLFEIADFLEMVKEFDYSVLLYLRTVLDGYSVILENYNKKISDYTEENQTYLLNVEEIKRYENAQSASSYYNRMTQNIKKRIDPQKRKLFWMHLTKEQGQDLENKPYFKK